MEPQCVHSRVSLWLSIFCLCLLTVVSASASAFELTAEEQQWLIEHPVVRVGIDPSWPPYEFIDQQGQYQGISADYLTILSTKLGIKFVVGAPLPWTETQKKLENKELDISPSIAETPKRRKFLNFTQAYISFPVVILTRANEPFIGQIEELSGQRVGVEADYFTDDILQNYYPNQDDQAQKAEYPI